SRRLIAAPRVRHVMVAICGSAREGSALRMTDVRFGSKADICSANSHVRFTPNSDRESGLPQAAMSALPPKADSCTAATHVRYGPIADSSIFIRLAHRRAAACRMEPQDRATLRL